MKYNNILLTGSSGNLGQVIVKSKIFKGILTPSRKEFGMTDFEQVDNYLQNNKIDAIIHCAALARMKECEQNPKAAIESNIIGTCNVTRAAAAKEITSGKSIRFIYISTDGVYAGTKGNYSEKDDAIPYNKYGWSKLGAENIVKMLNNFCIIRTSFFDPNNIKFDDAATDMYSSKMPVQELVKAIKFILENGFVGTINIGEEKKPDYERCKKFKPSIKSVKFTDILKKDNIPLAKDASMDCSLWEKIKNGK